MSTTQNTTKRKSIDQWIALTKEALDNGEEIRPNARYVYNNEQLGAFLNRVKNRPEIVSKLKEIGFDYKKAKKNSIREKRYKEWLKLLKECLNDPEVKLQFNHRFKYKGENLGTFLVDSRRNKKLMTRIKKTGFDYNDYLRKPDLYVQRFIKDLQNTTKAKKPKFITRFYKRVLPKKDYIDQESIDEINRLWKKKFGDRRVWRYPLNDEQRIVIWKRFRYDKERNPEGKWLRSVRIMGDDFNYAYRRKRKPYLMLRIEKYFNKEELQELREEGFFKHVN